MDKYPETRHVSGRLLRCVPGWLLFLCLAQLPVALAQAGDPADLQCDDPTPVGGAWDMYQCYFPGQSVYVPNNVPWSYPAAFLVPRPVPGDNSLQVKLQFAGYSARPYSCTDPSFSEAGYITIKNCPGHYPDLELHAVGGIGPLGWWGQYFGDSNGHRLSVSLDKAGLLWGAAIDAQAGLLLKGNSYGGTGAILQSLVLPDSWWRSRITAVWADVPNTLFVKRDPDPLDGVDERGQYWRNPAVQLAWGSYNTDNADIVQRAASVRHIYYRVNGSPVDTSVVFDLDFFRDLCNDQQVACFGTWHNNGHNINEPGVNLPYFQLFSSTDMTVRLDQVLPVFTNSTANHWGPRGHYNLGLEWGDAASFVDTPDSLQVPIRYRRVTGIGGGVPDQPASATFDLTLRRVRNFDLPVGTIVAWVIGEQSGHAAVKTAGEITIKGITLPSSAGYSVLAISLHALPGC